MKRTSIVILLTLVLAPSFAASIDEQTRQHVDHIRNIRAEGDGEQTEKYNKQMDEAWKYFEQNRQSAIPILRDELTREIEKPQRSDLVLLDIGSFLYKGGSPSDKQLATRALYTIDVRSEIIQWNKQELFLFTHMIATDRDARVLEFIDKTFLRGELNVLVPQHAMTLDETLICAFLYGVYGPESEAHLITLLGDPAIAKRTTEILSWIGTPASAARMKAILQSSKDYETFARVTNYMMTMAGPPGRETMLALDPKTLDTKSQQYYTKIRGSVESVSYQGMRKQFESMGPAEKLSDDAMKKRLAEMFKNNGIDDKTTPLTVLDSTLPSEYLVEELMRIRSRMFRRISDEALSDIQMTNALLNALRYKGT